jgi:hypothetical protein
MRKDGRWSAVLPGLLVLACGAPPAPELPSGGERGFRLDVTGTVVRGSAVLPFVPTREWQTGDAIQLAVRASRGIFVLVAYCDSSHTMSLYPENGALHVPADHELHIPPDGVFRVDANPGVESLYVVGSAEPLEQGDTNLAAQLAQRQAPQIGKSSADALELSTGQSRAAAAAPASQSQRAPGPTSRRPRAPVELPSEYVPRGLAVEVAGSLSMATRSDSFGLAILAFRRAHRE